MFKFKHQYAKIRMAAFIHKELPPEKRRIVARQIDGDDASYAAYVQERNTAAELERRLSQFGKPEAAALDRVWANVQAEITPPPKPRPQPRYSFGLAALLAVFALMIPLMLGEHNARTTVPEQPAPQLQVETAVTPTRLILQEKVTAIAQVIRTEPGNLSHPRNLHNTPLTGTPEPAID